MQKSTPEDSAIIARFQSGKKEAFDDLVQKHRDRVYRYAIHLTKNAEEANDVVEDAFIRVYRSLMDFRGDSMFTTWLYRIVTNCFLDMRKRRHQSREVSLEDLTGPQCEVAKPLISEDLRSPHEHIEIRERIGLIATALKQLPQSHQTILMMYHADSMSYDEIAGSLRLPIGTVKSRLNRSRLRLRQALHPWRKVFIA
jgi:RNA polymerase sigma-70 factor (ECF subfamily)